ncbi:MAG: hypothetical protein LBD18_02870 [Treponema sp.]|jgi:hypothetical protein|nr:hypothetical protein [Treponema sp.]
MSEKTGFKAMLGKKLYDIQYCDYHNNRHIKTLMPEVSQIFIDRYLRAKAKETTRNETGIFSQRPAGLQRAMNAP